MTKDHTLECQREEVLSVYNHHTIIKVSMKQLGRTGLWQRAASAAYDALAVMLFNIIHIVFFAKAPKKRGDEPRI